MEHVVIDLYRYARAQSDLEAQGHRRAEGRWTRAARTAARAWVTQHAPAAFIRFACDVKNLAPVAAGLSNIKEGCRQQGGHHA